MFLALSRKWKLASDKQEIRARPTKSILIHTQAIYTGHPIHALTRNGKTLLYTADR